MVECRAVSGISLPATLLEGDRDPFRRTGKSTTEEITELIQEEDEEEEAPEDEAAGEEAADAPDAEPDPAE